MNKWIGIGRLTKDPDIRYSQNGDKQMAVARYTLAVDRPHTRQENQQNADFISCVAFDKCAEFAEKYLRKGTKIAIEGRIQTGSYTNKDGVRVYTTDIVVEKNEFCESRNLENNANNSNQGGNINQNAENGTYGQNSRSQRHSGSYSGGSNPAHNDDFMNIPDGVDDADLPFN